MRKLAIITIVLVLAIVAGNSEAAFASAAGSSTGTLYGVGVNNSVDIEGSGLNIRTVEVWSEPTLHGKVTFPNFVGCKAHTEFYNAMSGPNHRDWNSSTMSCNSFVKSGADTWFNLHQNVPAGRYCGRIWVQNGSKGYEATNPACFNVHK